MVACKRQGRLIGGCHFEPRYDTGPSNVIGEISGSGATCIEFAKASRAVTYVRDVCVSCGRTIERGG